MTEKGSGRVSERESYICVRGDVKGQTFLQGAFHVQSSEPQIHP